MSLSHSLGARQRNELFKSIKAAYSYSDHQLTASLVKSGSRVKYRPDRNIGSVVLL